MASRDADPIAGAVATAIILGGIGILVALAGPVFLVVGIVFVGYRIFVAYRRSPLRLAANGHQASLLLFAQAQQLARSNQFPSPEDFADDVAARFLDTSRDAVPLRPILAELLEIPELLYRLEGLAFDTVPPPPDVPDTILDARYQDAVGAVVKKARSPAAIDAVRTAIIDSLQRFSRLLPRIALGGLEQLQEAQGRPLFTVPLIQTLANAGELVDALITPFFDESATDLDLFVELRVRLDQNVRDASGLKPGEVNPAKLVWPAAHPGTPAEIVRAYLRGTPFEAVFAALLPFSIPQSSRMEHWHLVAGSGHGKTQTLQHIVMHDLTAEDRPALFVIDSQGDMLRKLQRLQLFAPGQGLSDRLVLIDPEDEAAPALNMFDAENARLSRYSRSERETIEAGVIELYNYIFGALASELTAKQGTAFAFVVRLMLVIPGATIHTFRQLMEDPAQTLEKSPFEPGVRMLDETSKAFFRNQFFSKGFVETRQQIARRLYGVLQVPAFDRMFSSRENRLDMFAAMQAGNVVLINTAKALLKTDASALFGRYAISLVLKAAYERVAVPEGQRRPAYLVVDEAAEYFDSTLERLLIQARKYNLGVLFVHQYVDQLTPALRAAVSANTSIKMAGGVSDHDARTMAPSMRTDAEFLLGQQKDGRSTPKWTQFACHVRNLTPTAVSVTVPFGTLENAPTMSRQAHQELLQRNRARFGVRPDLQPAAPQPSDGAGQSDVDAEPAASGEGQSGGSDWSS